MSTIIDSPMEASDVFNCTRLYEALPNAKKQMLYDLLFDLLPDKKISNCGFYFQQLLDMHNMTYSELANYIIGYMECMDENAKEKEPEHIKSGLESLLKAKTYKEDNYLVKYVCDFFSISEDVLKYGYGEKYSIDMEIVAQIFDEQHITTDEFIENIVYKVDEGYVKYSKDCDYYILNSHKVFADIIENQYFVDAPVAQKLLKTEEFSLLDKNGFLEYFQRLKETERKAILHLMENMKKELDNQ